MEQDVQLQRGLSREVLRHGLLPRIRNLARRFADRSANLCPSALCCSSSSSPPRGIMKTIQQSNANMGKVLNESYRSLYLPQFMAAEDAPPPIKTLPLAHKPATMKGDSYWDSPEEEQPSTLARMSSSSTSTDELHYEKPCQTTHDLSVPPKDQVDPSTFDKGLVKTVDSATQYEPVEVGLVHRHCPVTVVNQTTTSSAHVPQLATASTQADLTMIPTGPQYDHEKNDLAIQATSEMASMGIQCAREMVSATTQAGPSVQCSGVQAVVDMASSAIQAVVDTRNSSVQAVHDTKTQGTQHELVSITTSTQTEEQSQTKDTSPADLREEIVSLVQRYAHNCSTDVEDKVRQFLYTIKVTYKEGRPDPASESHPLCHAPSKSMVPSGEEAEKSTANWEFHPPKVQGLPQAVDRHGQHSSGLMVQQTFKTAIEGNGPGYAQRLTTVLLNTEDTRDKGRNKDEDRAVNVEQSVHSGQARSSQFSQRIPTLGLRPENIPNLNDAINDVEGLPRGYFNTVEDITSSWREYSSRQTTGQTIRDSERASEPGQYILPADELRSQACSASNKQDDPTVSHAQSITLVCGAESGDIWGEIEEAMEGCGEPEVSYLPEEAAKAQESNSPDRHRDIPLPGTYWLTESLSSPWFFLVNREVTDRREHALYLRGGVKSESDKDRTTYDFDWEEAVDISKTCELAPRPSDSCENRHKDLSQHIPGFAFQLNQLLQQVQGSAKGPAVYYEQFTGAAKDTNISCGESFTIVNNEETKGTNACNSNMVASDDAAPSVMHVEDFLDAQHTPETCDVEDEWVNVQNVNIIRSNDQASQKRCVSRTKTTPRQVKGLTEKDGAVGGLAAEYLQPRFYQDGHGYQVPDIEVPSVKKDDVEVQLRDDGSKWILGTGSFGTVEAAFYRSPEGPIVEVAVKKCLLEDRGAVIREGKMMQFLQNTDVFPKFYGFMDIDEGSPGAIYLVSELFGRGTTLADIMHGVGYCLEAKDWMSICIQLANGLRKIHQMQVVFSDLKENNILVDITRDPVVRFIDLGISTFQQGITYGFTADELRPLRHIAPEVKHGAPTSVLSDIWGLGILLLDIATLSGVPGLENVAGAALAENPQLRVCLDGIITALVTISTSQNLF